MSLIIKFYNFYSNRVSILVVGGRNETSVFDLICRVKVCGFFLVVSVRLLVVCSPFLVVCGGLWWFVGGLCLFADSLWSFPS